MKINTTPAVIIALLWAAIFGAVVARPRHSIGQHIVNEPMQVTKTVPEGSTLELRINGQVSQSINIKPGTYKIIVEQLH
jgi:hypothetical protein